jgi:NAD(P)-dependent dehydrogenase (short-subunit alcohol dehydrogenase family)
MKTFRGRVAVITGAGSGIGFALTRAKVKASALCLGFVRPT